MNQKMSKKVIALKVIANNFFMLKYVWVVNPTRILLTLAVNLINGSINFLSQIYLLRFIINAVIENKSYTHVLFVAMLIFIYQIFASLLNIYFYQIFCPKSDNIIKNHFQNTLFDKALSLDLSDYDNPEFYNIFTRALSESNNRAIKTVDLLGNLVNILFTLLSVSFVIFSLEPYLILIALTAFISSFIVGKIRNYINYKQNFEMTKQKRIRDYVQRVVYSNKYAKEIRLSNIYKVLKLKFDNAINESINIVKKYAIKNVIVNIAMPIINQVFVYYSTILYVGYKTLVKNTLPLADCIVIIRSIWQVSNTLSELSNSIINLHNQSLYVDNINKFLERSPKVINQNKTINVNTVNENIIFRNVSFKYENENRFVLKNISFNISKGEKIALVGLNGAGKTSLLKLLLRLYDPTSGTILLDGKDIKRYDIDSYRNLYSTVLQDLKMFSLSISDNILCGIDKDESVIYDSLKASGLLDKVIKLEKGINTVITKEFDEHGVIFSGGEVQRLALSRAFAKDCPIIILDEPSSALDPISENKLFENILNICKEKTVILVSHRLSSVTSADKILVLKDGEIVEQGNHKKLMMDNKFYAKLFKRQAQNYKESDVL